MELSLRLVIVGSSFSYISVSILVLMELSLRLSGSLHGGNPYIIVSILVLMELSLRQRSGSVAGHERRSFNPCFNGTLSKTRLCLWSPVMPENVSILVLMELSLRPFVWNSPER